ncbi:MULTISPECIES: HAD-IA family hydrolase [unclassified Microbacterium]|uniref:HAD-IA family hydrolase n=1 Tax=unclassified Microbacterium TaxID=2609290 RepID=UPI000CFDABBC|nr:MULTISPECIES: HAD-IA family hydrolase [unclassified Microbacterium]PQZ58312.1 HAD family hydrolase [Microbacterium sp. MYb43]PQZ73746.1 HAD family hydrolase [Microbacterium sp. MYb40]PRB20492.1 HAD family hydrolase [Microbacterium sp. MYb50]PRB20523.1 HAD family hydrolase [Microbacterium sp. MYb54]PRB66147.1 HAD family hydrolase [Microbacterium sp. MYb32]
MTKHLLVDFGEVISEPQPTAAIQGMAAVVGIPTTTFRARYWASREPYDRGLPAADYWEDVVGRRIRGEELLTLRRLDIESWTHLNFATIAALRAAHSRGAQLTLLSNAPSDLAAEIRHAAVLRELFSLMVFSAELRLAKPDAEIFDTALALAEAAPEDTLFIDDRVENLEAARERGIRTHRFRTAADLDAELTGIDFDSPRRRSPWWARVRSATTALRPAG